MSDLDAILDRLVERVADAVAERLGRPALLTREQLCTEYHVTARTVRRAEQSGALPVRRAGHARLYMRRDVEAWLAGRVSSTPANDHGDIVEQAMRAAGKVRR